MGAVTCSSLTAVTGAVAVTAAHTDSYSTAVVVGGIGLVVTRVLGECVILPQRLAPSEVERAEVSETLSWIDQFTIEPTLDPATSVPPLDVDLREPAAPAFHVEDWQADEPADLTPEVVSIQAQMMWELFDPEQLHREIDLRTSEIPAGYCQCGCGAQTSNVSGTGQGAHTPRRYVRGHNLRHGARARSEVFVHS
jgi:hypothetical protein